MLVTLLFLCAAVICYLVGFSLGAGLFIMIGAVFETVVWLRIFGKRISQNRRLNTL